MRYILGFGVVLAVANLTGAVEMASAYQAPAAGRTVPSPPLPAGATATASPTQTPAGTLTSVSPTQTPAGATATASPTQTPAGAPTTTTSPGSLLTAPGNLEQQANERSVAPIDRVAPGVTTAAPGTTSAAPGTVVPGTVNPQPVPGRTYSSNYVPGAQPAQTPVTPMAEIPYYGSYYGAAAAQPGTSSSGYYGYPAGTYGYSSMYVTPGYGYRTGTTTYAPARRGPFGLFGRRNAQVYTTGPYGTTYSTAPYGYTSGAAPYNYGYSTPGTYTYGTFPR
jgi:hypothetical protein